MADIFISYKSERRKAAEHVAAVLGLYGYSVWFDYQLVKGSDFGLQIDRRIREAKALVALWCSLSVGSRWVIEEADLAHELGILIPVKIEPCNLPVGFRRPDYTNLSSWDGSPRSHQLDPLIDALAQRIGRPPQIDYAGMRAFEAEWRRYGAPPLRDFALGKPGAEEGRHLPPAGTGSGPAVTPPAAPVLVNPTPVNNGHELTALAGREWPDVRDSADPQRLKRFARHFAETYYAEEARALLDRIEAEDWRQREAAATAEEEDRRQREAAAATEEKRLDQEAQRLAQEQKFRAEGRIPVLVGDRKHSETRWLLPGGGQPFCDITGGPEMLVVPAGKFMMGSPDSEPGRASWEGPQHEVTFAQPFAVGRDAVTRGQFAAFVNATGYGTTDLWRNPDFNQDNSHPVVCVTWDDAKAYAAWLAEITGRPYRLLSEAEWEYAARAGTTTPFWWGSSITPAQANYDGRQVYEGGGSKGEYRAGTVPAGSFRPNPWGLYNVHGNVWEWCEDAWHVGYSGAPTDGSAWISGNSGRVVRGGSWSSDPWYLRAAQRLRLTAVIDLVGVRVARTLSS
jgi:formylglycine-generating enzyme required for sulfatase activity